MGYEKPAIFFLGSPMACHLAVNEIVETPITGFYVDNLNFPTSPIFFNYPDAIQPVRWAVSESFHSILYNIESIFDSIFYYTIMNELENKEIPMYGVENHSYSNQLCFGAEYDYWLRIGAIKSDGLKRYIEYLKSYPGYTIFLEDFAFVCGLPREIHVDVEAHLHCESGPAIRWEDGYSQYYWHGISIQSQWIDEPLSITREDFLSERNAEKRRVLHEILGTDRLVEILDLEIVDVKKVPFQTWDREAFLKACQTGKLGSEMIGFTEDKILTEPEKILPFYDSFIKTDFQTVTLLRTLNNSDGHKKAQFIKVQCPSTGEVFHLGVPENFTNALEARAWTLYEDEKNGGFET